MELKKYTNQRQDDTLTEENKPQGMYYKSFSYDDYTQVISEDNSSIDLYYKTHLIYSYDKDNDFIEEDYITPSGQYLVSMDPKTQDKSIEFIPQEYVEQQEELVLEFSKKLESKNPIKQILAQKYYMEHSNSTVLFIRGQYILDKSDERIKEFERLEKKYKILNKALPYLTAKDVLEDAIEDISNYLVTSQIDFDDLNDCVISLEACGFVEKSASLLRSFVDDPKNCDIQNLLQQLNYYLKNISSIIKVKADNLDKDDADELGI